MPEESDPRLPEAKTEESTVSSNIQKDPPVGEEKTISLGVKTSQAALITDEAAVNAVDPVVLDVGEKGGLMAVNSESKQLSYLSTSPVSRDAKAAVVLPTFLISRCIASKGETESFQLQLSLRDLAFQFKSQDELEEATLRLENLLGIQVLNQPEVLSQTTKQNYKLLEDTNLKKEGLDCSEQKVKTNAVPHVPVGVVASEEGTEEPETDFPCHPPSSNPSNVDMIPTEPSPHLLEPESILDVSPTLEPFPAVDSHRNDSMPNNIQPPRPAGAYAVIRHGLETRMAAGVLNQHPYDAPTVDAMTEQPGQRTPSQQLLPELEATLVQEDHDEENNNNHAIIVEAKPLECIFSRRSVACAAVALFALIVGLILGLGVYGKDDNGRSIGTLYPTSEAPSMSPTESPMPTLQRIRERGVLRCGYVSYTGRNTVNTSATDQYQITLCKALAAAIMGFESYQAEFVMVNQNDFPTFLANGSVDVIPNWPITSMQGDVYQESAEVGFSFAIPYFYDGQTFGGPQKYVDCGDDEIKTFFECSDISICLFNSDRGSKDYIVERVPGRNLVFCDNTTDFYLTFANGGCNVLYNAKTLLAEGLVRRFGYEDQDYTRGKTFYSHDQYSTAVRDDDSEFLDFVNAVTLSFISAERHNITRANAELFGATDLFGDAYKNMFMDAIRVASNYHEIYSLSLEKYLPREGWNLINDGSTGLLTSFSATSRASEDGPGPIPGGTLERILARGSLRCAVQTNRTGFAYYASYNSSASFNYYSELSNSSYALGGLDVEYCRALSASIFAGEAKIVFLEVSDAASGFRTLSSGDADVYAGASWTLQNDVKEPNTGEGFSFSKPYFYRPMAASYATDTRFQDNLCIATRQDDSQFSSFVYWAIGSLVDAEVNGITQREANDLPVVGLFGPLFGRMFRDAVHAVGNHGEVYGRTVGPYIARSDRNMINRKASPGPQHYIPPGFDELATQ